MARGEYGSSKKYSIGAAKKQEAVTPAASAALDLRSNPQAPIEAIRDEATKIAQYQSLSPKTRNVIVALLSSDGWSALSFNSVEEANTETARVKESLYVAYFEKGSNRLLFEWDRRRPGGAEQSWWPQVDYQTTGAALGFGVLLGIVIGSKMSFRSPVHRRR
jgi:hypothetical protein